LGCCALAWAALWQGPGAARADATDFLAQAIGRVAGKVRVVSNKSNFGYNEGTSLLGAYMAAGASTSFRQELVAGNTYEIWGGGDDDATDLDLAVYDPDGQRIVVDEDPDATPGVRFRATRRGYYTIRLALAGSRAKGSFCAMAILRDGGWDVPADNLILATARCVKGCQAIANQGLKLRFHDEPNQWSFFGGVVPQGQATTIKTMTLGEGGRIFIAAGDSHARDLDLFLLDDDGDPIAGDNKDDAVPVFFFPTRAGRSYRMRLMNERSDGPPLVVSIILDE
jgi:hypothetical protein